MCLECVNDYYLSSERRCVPCLSPSEIIEGLNCVECVQNCQFCASKGVCLKCKEGFFLKGPDMCGVITKIKPNISFGSIQNIIILDFGPESESFVDFIYKNALENLVINISNFSKNDFSVTYSKNSSSKVFLMFNFAVSVLPGTVLSVDIQVHELIMGDSKLIIENSRLSLSFNSVVESCSVGFVKSLSKYLN